LVAELAGAVAAAALLKYFSPGAAFDSVNGGTPAVASGYAIGKAVLVEAVATFFLVWAVFGTAVDDRGAFNKIGGFAIGLGMTIGAQADEVVFTSGGTESVSLAIWGCVRALRELGTRIVVSAVEHPAVGGICHILENDGFETVLVPVDRDGVMDLDRFAAEV